MPLGSSEKGKAVETLLAATCILGSDGRLSVSVPFVDDEGVDLIFTPKGGGRSLSVQVKSRFTMTGRGYYRSQIRRKTFRPREDFYFVFAHYDVKKAQLGKVLWFIPSLAFKTKLVGQTNKRIYVFQSGFSSQDMWQEFRCALRDLPRRITEVLKALNSSSTGT